MKSYLVLFKNNTMLLKLTGLKNAASGGGYMNAATVSAQIKDATEAAVGAPVTLSYVAASDGNYEGTVAAAAAVAIGGAYTVEITATQAGLQYFSKPASLKFTAETR